MPRGDKTGPMGMGSGTGRNMGYCSGADAPGFASAPGRGGMRQGFGQGGRGRGCGFGRGGGMRGGRRQGPAAFAGQGQSTQDQAPQAQAILDALEAISQRISKLENAAHQD